MPNRTFNALLNKVLHALLDDGYARCSSECSAGRGDYMMKESAFQLTNYHFAALVRMCFNTAYNESRGSSRVEAVKTFFQKNQLIRRAKSQTLRRSCRELARLSQVRILFISIKPISSPIVFGNLENMITSRDQWAPTFVECASRSRRNTARASGLNMPRLTVGGVSLDACSLAERGNRYL